MISRMRMSLVFLAVVVNLAIFAAPSRAQDAGYGEGESSALIIDEDAGLWTLFWKGGYVMPAILVASIVAVAFAIERAAALRAAVHLPERLAARTADRFREGGQEAAQSLVKGGEAALARMVAAALSRVAEGRRAMEEAAGGAASYALYDLKRNVRPLGIVAGVAPLLGLLGTVWGMIQAFDKVSLGGLGRSSLLAKGIAEALITTGAGLLVAIPALVAYHYLRGRAEDLVRLSEARTVEFIDRVLSENRIKAPARLPAEGSAGLSLSKSGESSSPKSQPRSGGAVTERPNEPGKKAAGKPVSSSRSRERNRRSSKEPIRLDVARLRIGGEG